VRWEETDEYPKGRLTGEFSIAPVFDNDGRCTHLVGAVHDITERKQLEAQFRQAQKMESVGQLAGGIAHDFNNLLTMINGTAELALAQLKDTDPLRVDLQEIRKAGEMAAALTRQLLAFSRKQIVQAQVMNLNLVVMPTRSLGNVKADPGQMEQVIANLAVNARDAMPRGGKLTIEMQDVEFDAEYIRQHGVTVKPGAYVMLAMSDTGIGMDDATRARIFEPFFTTKEPGKGTGLGLSTVYGIVKQTDGFIWVYSEVGLGTSFKIYLPRVAEVISAKPRSSGAAPAHGTETILLVEDLEGMRVVARRMLESVGYTVLTANNGEEALRLLDQYKETVHLMLSDVVMPGMSGRDLAEQLRALRPGMKVLYMSGYTDDAVVRHGVLHEGTPFLSKPFTAIDLTRKVREVLDSGVTSDGR
jgi:nitrogen-specific signal transduction histidine kinase/CheY-like chemotaxis protein